MVVEYKLKELNASLLRKSARIPGLEDSVRKILRKVKEEGNEGVLYYERKFGGVCGNEEMMVRKEEIEKAAGRIDENLLKTLEFAALNIRKVCERTKPQEKSVETGYARIMQKYLPIESVGIYAPGGKAAYPSTVLMCAIPAKIAGVGRIALCTPSPVSDAVLAACAVAGVEEVYAIGGAQAIGALAYGTETIPKVQKIAGPGNAYVTEAKRQVRGENCDMDMLAGPTEVMIVADENARTELVAADALAQLEHGEDSIAVMICANSIAGRIRKEAEKQAKMLKRQKILKKSLSNLVIAKTDFGDLQKIADFINEFAPEHLELQTDRNAELLALVKNAGAVFIGENSCEAFGDYCIGSNHVLPTGGSAKFSSGLSVSSFMKMAEIVEVKKDGVRELAKNTKILAEAEGLDGHAKSAKKRMEFLEKEE